LEQSKILNKRYGDKMTSRELVSKEQGLYLLKKMREIRQFQERVVALYPTDVMVTPVHLHIGQEAVPVGVCANLNKEDTISFTHRTHGPALAKGMDMKRLMAELYGRTTGCSKGRGGSMHVIDVENGMFGSSSIVGGGIAVGVGSGLAIKLKNENRIAVSYFGDGATDCGAFWESINFAALREIPVLFVCENNHLSNTMKKADHMYADLGRVAKEFMTTFQADGTDVLDVFSKGREAVQYIRKMSRPAFLECPTYRWMKHQGADRDDLPYNQVDTNEACPIRRLEKYLLENRLATSGEIASLVADIERTVDEAIAFAANSPFPHPDDLIMEV
jgi:TPP-dependent pyruvate/acetoin dehydrogenase alpha subunit